MKRRFTKSIFFTALIAVGFFAASLISESAFAVPPFARKYKTSCQMCHSVPGVLNGFGRAFKRNGYVMPGNEPAETGDLMSEQIEELPGFGGLMEVEGKFYLKREDKSQKKWVTDITMPEIEFFMAGNTGNIGYIVVFLTDLGAGGAIDVEAAQAQFNDVGVKGLNVKVGHMLTGPQHIDGFWLNKGIGTITPKKTTEGANKGPWAGAFGSIDTSMNPGTGFEINGEFGPAYFGLGVTTGIGRDSKETTKNQDFHMDYYGFFEYRYGKSGGGFWSNDMLTFRLHFYLGTEDELTAVSAGNAWVKKMRLGATIDFNYEMLVSTLTFVYDSVKYSGSASTNNGAKGTGIGITADIAAIFMNGKLAPQMRFEYYKTSGKDSTGATVTQTQNGVEYPAEMWLHLGLASMVRSNSWFVVGARLWLNAGKHDEYNGSALVGGKKKQHLVDVIEAKVIVAY